MKSLKKVLTVMVLFISVFILTGCGKKEPITYGTFHSKLSDKGFRVVDVGEQFENYSSIKKAYVAQSKDATYQIEYYELVDNDAAQAFFDNNKNIFLESIGNVSKSKLDITKKEYARFHVTSKGYYFFLSRNKNTVIYARVTESHKSDVVSITKELGY